MPFIPRRTKQQTIDNLQQIEVMNRALGDMPAVSLGLV
jgi:hypothetical protein